MQGRGSSGGDSKAGGSSDGERQDPKDETSQGEKGKALSVRGGDIKEDESRRKHKLDWLPQIMPSWHNATGTTATQTVGFVGVFFIRQGPLSPVSCYFCP